MSDEAALFLFFASLMVSILFAVAVFVWTSGPPRAQRSTPPVVQWLPPPSSLTEERVRWIVEVDDQFWMRGPPSLTEERVDPPIPIRRIEV